MHPPIFSNTIGFINEWHTGGKLQTDEFAAFCWLSWPTNKLFPRFFFRVGFMIILPFGYLFVTDNHGIGGLVICISTWFWVFFFCFVFFPFLVASSFLHISSTNLIDSFHPILAVSGWGYEKKDRWDWKNGWFPSIVWCPSISAH